MDRLQPEPYEDHSDAERLAAELILELGRELRVVETLVLRTRVLNLQRAHQPAVGLDAPVALADLGEALEPTVVGERELERSRPRRAPGGSGVRRGADQFQPATQRASAGDRLLPDALRRRQRRPLGARERRPHQRAQRPALLRGVLAG